MTGKWRTVGLLALAELLAMSVRRRAPPASCGTSARARLARSRARATPRSAKAIVLLVGTGFYLTFLLRGL